MSNSQNSQFYKSDFDLNPITLVLKLDLDMVMMYHHTKNEVSTPRHSKVIARADRQADTHTCTHTHTHAQTHKQYENITFPHTRAVKMYRECTVHINVFYECVLFDAKRLRLMMKGNV